MKKAKKTAVAALSSAEMTSQFTRGAVAVGMLTALQGRFTEKKSQQTILRMALQGGIAMAAGVATAESLRYRQYAAALLAAAAGTAGVFAAERLLSPKSSPSVMEDPRVEEE